MDISADEKLSAVCRRSICLSFGHFVYFSIILLVFINFYEGVQDVSAHG